MAKFRPGIQINGLRELDNDLITNFSHNWILNNTLILEFNLTQVSINTDNVQVQLDLSSYKVKIVYKNNAEPRVFVKKPAILNKAPHRFPDGSLCLFKKSNFKWTNNCSIAKETIPLIIMWVYYYEEWLRTGIWFGKEASH